MTDTLILQSYRTKQVSPWIISCLASVKTWAAERQYAYEFMDDSLFDPVPDWYRKRCSKQLLPVTDLARLLQIQRRFDAGWERVVWIDADVLVFNPKGFSIDIDASCALTRELWTGRNAQGKLYCSEGINNSTIVMRRGNAMLPFLIYASETLVRNTPIEKIDHVTVGTRFLSRLALAMPIARLNNVGMFSPALIKEVAAGGSEFTRLFAQHSQTPIAAANLCASLIGMAVSGVSIDDQEVGRAVDRLLSSGGKVINDLLPARSRA